MLEADDLGEKILIKTLHKEAHNRLIPGKPDPIGRIGDFYLFAITVLHLDSLGRSFIGASRSSIT
jgi:hypothetical protein